MQPITKQQIDAILPFLDCFKAIGFSAGTWKSSSDQMPWFHFNDSVMKFKRALYDNGWLAPSVEWTKLEWKKTAMNYVRFPDRIESAEAETIQRLFTSHFRKERLCEGHLAAMFENGHVLALLRRLQEIRRTMDE